MTAVECLKQDIDLELKHGTKMVVNWDMYLQMEKQQIEEAYSNGRVDEQFKGTGASFYVTKAEQYYNETFKNK